MMRWRGKIIFVVVMVIVYFAWLGLVNLALLGTFR
jgi:hypothetical protein